MYECMRTDLSGQPRPLHLDRAFDNLVAERRGKRVRAELVAEPRVLQCGDGWQLMHLRTHPEHFYDVHRFEFAGKVEAATDGSPHVPNLVEGEAVTLETAQGLRQRFNFAETFVVPAAAEGYRLVNEGARPAKVIKAFIKPEIA